MEIETITMYPYYTLKDLNCISLNKRAKFTNILDEREKGKFTKIYDYFLECFISRHSTIDCIQFKIVDENCRGDIASHLVRHTKKHPRYVVGSCRPDWNNGKKRKPLDEEFKYFGSVWSVSAFQEMAAQRLCYRAADYTRKWVLEVMKQMDESGDPVLMACSMTCVPNCIRYAGCIEGKRTCGKKIPEVMTTDIAKRMKEYHEEVMRH